MCLSVFDHFVGLTLKGLRIEISSLSLCLIARENRESINILNETLIYQKHLPSDCSEKFHTSPTNTFDETHFH